MNYLMLKADLNEAIMEASAVVLIALVVLLIALIVGYIKKIKADKQAMRDERRELKHKAYQKQAEDMQQVYASLKVQEAMRGKANDN